VEERWMGAWNLRKAGVFSRTVRGCLNVLGPKLSDECPGVYQLLAQQQTRYATPGVGGKFETLGPAFSVRLPGWRGSCTCRVRGIISSSADLYAAEISCWGQM
jgi:hypothetical protein